MQTLELPNNLTSIGSSAFISCTNLTKLHIPPKVTSIGVGAFSNCTKLNITVDAENTNFSSEKSILMNRTKTNMIWVSQASEAISEGIFTIPDSITTIGTGLISGYTNINKVVIPASVTSLDSGFFTQYVKSVEIDSQNATYESDGKAVYNKGKITLYKYITPESSIQLPDTLRSIGDAAFSFMKETVTSIEFPDSLETIGNTVFHGCTKLTSVQFGTNLRAMGDYPFSGSSITTVTINDANPNYTVEGKGIYTKDKSTLCYVYGEDSTFIVNENTKKVREYAFQDRENLVSVNLQNVEEIGTRAFQSCGKLNSVIMNKVKVLGSAVFIFSSIPTVDIPNSIESIDKGAFAAANNLITIYVHKKKGSIEGVPWGAVLGDRAIIWDE